jgi:hypothetical protein
MTVDSAEHCPKLQPFSGLAPPAWMPFLCRWPNGDFSVVKASSKDEAIELLDEIGNAEGSPLTPIKDNFMVHFVLTDDGDFELQGWGEETGELIIKRAYPVLDEARMSSLDKSDTERTEMICHAVAKQRERVVEKRVKTPKTLLGQDLKGMMETDEWMVCARPANPLLEVLISRLP